MSIRSEVIRIYNELIAGSKKISELPLAGAITGAELVEIVQNGVNVQTTTSQFGGGGGGTVTSFSAGNLSPLFTTSVATATTTPALTFALSNQNANKVFAGPTTGADAAPTFRALVAADIPDLSAVYQPLLNGTGFVKASGTTISYDNSTYLTANQTITLSGDVSGSGSTSISTTLATVNSNVGSFGSATQVGTFTVNGKGLITAASNVSITPAVGSITGLGTGVATALAVNVGSSGAFVTKDGALGTPSSGTATNLTGTASGLTAGTVTTNANLTGEVTSVGNAATLTNSAVIGKVLTGYTSGSGTVDATDTILQAIQKLNGNDALKWQTTGTTTVTTPTISGDVTWSQSSQSATNTFHSFTQAAHTGGTPTGIAFTGGAHTTLANASTIDLNFNLNRTVQFGQNTTLALQTAVLFDMSALTYSSSAATKTITKAIGVQIKGIPTAGTNVSITNPYAFAVTDNNDNIDVALGSHNSNFGALIFGTQARASAPSIGAATNPTTFSGSGNNFKFQSGSVAANGRAGFSFAATSSIGFASGTSTNSWIYSNAGITLSNSGTSATHNHLDLQPGTTSVTSGTSFTLNNINSAPTIDIGGTVTTALVRGFYYNPTQTTVGSNVTHKAWEHTAGYIQWNSTLTPSQITSNQDNYNPTGWTNGGAPNGASILRLDTDASRNLTSLAGGLNGRLVLIANIGAFNLVIKNDDGSTGTAANRFALNADITLLPGQSLMFWYDGTSSRWRANKN